MDDRREEELVRRLQQRDERAFVECVRTYQDKIFGLLYRMLGSREEAQDVAQKSSSRCLSRSTTSAATRAWGRGFIASPSITAKPHQYLRRQGPPRDL